MFLICVAVPGYAETDAIVQWKKEIVDRLTAAKQFPLEARRQRETGSATVGFVIDRSGKLVSSWLRESTGSPILDAAALAMVDRAQPFPAPPPELDDDRLSFVVPVIFSRGRPSDIDVIKDADIRKEETVVNAKIRSLCKGC